MTAVAKCLVSTTRQGAPSEEKVDYTDGRKRNLWHTGSYRGGEHQDQGIESINISEATFARKQLVEIMEKGELGISAPDKTHVRSAFP